MRAEEFKSAGNAAYTAGRYQDAVEEFTKAMGAIAAETGTDREAQQFLKLLYSNRCAAYLQLKDNSKALDDANKIVDSLDPEWAKGHIRRGDAYFALGDWTRAYKAYQRAERLSPNDYSYKAKTEKALERVRAEDVAADGAQTAYGAASDFINNPETQAFIGEGFGELDKAYTMSVTEAKEGIMIASGLPSDRCLAIIPLLRIEIFRDFSQLMGVVFGSAYSGAEGLMHATVSAFGGAFNIFTLNLGTAFQTETAAIIGFLIAFVLGMLSILLYVWLVCFSGVACMAEDEVRLGNEAEDFFERDIWS